MTRQRLPTFRRKRKRRSKPLPPPGRDHSSIRTRFVRCSNCNHRRALPKNLCDYARIPVCDRCGKRHWWADAFRGKRRLAERKLQCECPMYEYPHRAGYGQCMLNPSGSELLAPEVPF